MINFNELLSELSITLTDKQLKQFDDYFKFLVEYNNNVNLTAITEEKDVYIKHFYDSILVSKALDLSKVESLADVGSGAGFPSIPLKILYPHLSITIIDALEKRLVFLDKLSKLLNLDKINLVHSRAEDYKEGREKFDVVCVRFVSSQQIVNELCIPLTKVGGYFISMKGSNYEEELKVGNSLSLLGGVLENVYKFELPYESGTRAIIKIKHKEKTPIKYPRPFGMIKKKPL